MANVLEEIKKHIPKTADPSKHKRVERAKRDFFYFCKTYLPHLFKAPFCEFHKEVIRVLTDKKQQKIVLAAPRNHGKTTLVYVGYTLWAALSGREKYVVVVAASTQMAQEQLFNVKMELEVNEKIIEDFGDMKTGVWRQDNIELKNGVKIVAKGADASMRGLVRRGQRPTLVVLDDLEKDVVANSKTMRDKLDRWIKRVVFPLGRDAKIFYIGTILHKDSVLNRYLQEYKDKPGWFVRKFKAIKEDGTPLWPEYWTLEKLEEKKAEMGTAAFSIEYLNEPLSDEDQIFKPEWFNFYKPHELARNLDVVMAVDPALGKAKGDYSALVVVGKDRNTGLIYVLEAIGEKLSDLKLCDRIVELFLKYRPRKILFEDVAFQAIYKREISRLASARGITLPLKGVKPSLSKEARIQAIAPLIENGVLLFQEKQTLLLQQLEEFPMGRNDDLPDALAYAISELQDMFYGGVPVGQRFGMDVVGRLGQIGKEFFRRWI